LFTAHFLSDVLRHLAILCKAYQRSDIDFTEVNPLLLSTVEVLEGLELSDSDWEYREGSNNLVRAPNTDASPSSVNLDLRLSITILTN
jgi:succinyl-CoA synthetase beta subunit